MKWIVLILGWPAACLAVEPYATVRQQYLPDHHNIDRQRVEHAKKVLRKTRRRLHAIARL